MKHTVDGVNGRAEPQLNGQVNGHETGSADESEEEQDFDRDMLKLDGEEGPVEVIKGEQGRIAVRSSPRMYEILVWLPGFS